MPRIKEIIEIAIIRGIAAKMSARSGWKSSVTEVRIGDIDSFSVAACAYWTRVTSDTAVTARIRAFIAVTFSFRLSKNAMKDNGRLGFK
jgi:hypothetical protein